MPIDRSAILRNAEKLLRQGRIEQAIGEYLRVVEDQPRDWNTANLLGDLYVRAGQVERASEQFVRMADALEAEGFLSRANAVYKKVLKLDPNHEYALLKAGLIAARQGLVVDARTCLGAVIERRRLRGDDAGAAEATALLRSFDRATSSEAAPPVPAPPAVEEAAPEAEVASDAKIAFESEPEPEPVQSVAPREPVPPPEHPEPEEPVEPVVPVELSEPPQPAESFRDVAPVEPAPVLEFDLTDALEALLSTAPRTAPAQPAAPVALDDVFASFRDEASSKAGEEDALSAYQQGVTLVDGGRIDQGIARLAAASSSPRLRFAAASRIARIYQDHGRLTEAVEWFERAAEAPPTDAREGHLVLYELAGALEAVGEADRAMAVYLELKAEAGSFRDLDDRLDRLARVRAGG